jgi:2-aminoethylphosphonate transport system ATP-binding protein
MPAANGPPGAGGSAAPAGAGSSGITFEDVSVAYGDVTVLDSLSLVVRPGEIVALIGPSGSGKTTALRAVAGFVRPSRGRILIGTRDVTNVPPHARNIGMVVQNYALFPHMRVEENVAFGLRARDAPADVIRERIPECLRMVGMASFARRYPRELSGGQQQRVAIARALAIRPQVLLLDEPLSALDAQIRRSMLDELAKLHRELPSLTVLYVTHDQTEALTLANHIGIMRDGKLIAFGDAQSLYRNPPNRFAAEFLGRANLLPVQRAGHRRRAGALRRARAGGAQPSWIGRRRRLSPVRASARPEARRHDRLRQSPAGDRAQRALARRPAERRARRGRQPDAPRLRADARAARARRERDAALRGGRGDAGARDREPCLTPPFASRPRSRGSAARG